MESKVFVVIGSGPNIGVASASYFAEHKFSSIALISRDASRLSKDHDRIVAAANAHNRDVQVKTWSCDVTDTTCLESVLRDVEAMGPISCVLYNAALVVPTEIFKTDEAEIIYHIKTTSIGLYTAARWALPLLRRDELTNPAFLVTTGLLHDDPIPQLFSLSMAKAAQRTLVLALAKAWPDVHFALLYIDGPVAEIEVKNNPKVISQNLWELYNQEKENWQKGLLV